MLDADRLAARQMLQRGGVHRRQGQAPGYPRIVAVPATRRGDGGPVCPDAEARAPAVQLRMQAEASRIWHTALPW